MNILILDSWLREYLETKATPEQIGEALSLTSISAEKIEKYGDNDTVYDFEVTTNRPDLMSVINIAREAATVLNQEGIEAAFRAPIYHEPEKGEISTSIEVKNDPELVNRVLGVIMEVNLKESPEEIKKRLDASGIRSLNNIIDVTNYVMREVGHPTHVFDFDRLNTKTLTIQESKKGDEIETLDNKKYESLGGDIVALDDNGRIVDLLGVMGTENSVVTDNTKRIFFFIDNLNPHKVRKTSMGLGIRTEAAVLNEKGLDPELSRDALLRGIELYQKFAGGKIISEIIDIYPNKPEQKTVTVSLSKINDVVGIDIPKETSVKILKDLGFGVEEKGEELVVSIPSIRAQEVEIPEDIVEEIARIYGYHNLPSVLPPTTTTTPYHRENDQFYWEARLKEMMKYWGFTEVYTYSMVSEVLLEAAPEDAVTLQNPLTDDGVYMRTTLTPSILEVVRQNDNSESLKIFEIANVYHKKKADLPQEIRMFAGIIKQPDVKLLEVKGLIEQVFTDLGIKNAEFKQSTTVDVGADVFIGDTNIGSIELLDDHIVDFELNFEEILKHVSLKKVYKPVSKFPPIIEDVRILVNQKTPYKEIVDVISSVNDLVVNVELLDVYEDKKTFRVYYQDPTKNLTNEDVKPIREEILEALQTKLKAEIV